MVGRRRRRKTRFVVGRKPPYSIYAPVKHPPHCICKLCTKHRPAEAERLGVDVALVWERPLVIRARRLSPYPDDANKSAEWALQMIRETETLLKSALTRGTSRDPERITFAAAAAIYLKDHGAMMPASSLERAKQVIEHTRVVIVRDEDDRPFADLPCSSLRPVDGRGYQRARLAQTPRPANATINREWNTIRAILNYAAENDLIAANPIPAGSVEALPTPGPRTEFFHPSEWQRFIRAFDDDVAWRGRLEAEHDRSKERMWRGISLGKGGRRPDSDDAKLRLERYREMTPLIRAYLHTAARLEELTGLRWKDVDLAHGTVTIWQSKTAKVKPSKTLPLSSWMRADLQARRGIGDALVYRRGDGGRYSPMQVQRWMEVAKELSGVNPALTIHSIRHTAASWVTIAGFSETMVAELLGHSRKRRSTTAGYSHLASGSLVPIIAAIETIERDGYPEEVERGGKRGSL